MLLPHAVISPIGMDWLSGVTSDGDAVFPPPSCEIVQHQADDDMDSNYDFDKASKGANA